MAEQHNPNDPRYDWLYTGQSDAPGQQEGAPAEDLPDRPEPPESDHTRMLPRPSRSAGSAAAAAPPAAPPPAEPATQPVTSFGGTYPRRNPAAPPAGSAGASPRTGPPVAAGPPPAGSSTARYAQPTSARGGAGAPPGGPAGRGYAPPSAPSTPRSATAPPGGRKRKVRWVRIVLALLAAWLLFLVVVPIYAWTQVSKVAAEPSGARPADGPGTTYLLVGSDSRAGLTKAQRGSLGTGAASGQRTDTIIMLHVTDGSGPNIMLSIPRDSYVDIPGHGKNKINAAYSFGGPKLLVQTVEQATGVRVDDYIEIGFTGVVDVVDAVGGITVCPKTSIVDPKAGNLKMKAGCQEVNGHVALDYSRSRAFPLGDITRTLHQREVIAATGSAAASWKTVVLPWRYWNVNMAGANSVRVGDNVGPFAFARFAWAMAHSSGSGTRRCVVPFSSLGTSTSVGSVVTWDTTKANAIFNHIASDDTSAIRCKAQ